MGIEEWALWGALLVAGVVGGFANAVAGGASLICMPALVTLGLPVDVAIATNKLATTGQSVFTAFRYGQKGFFHWRIWAKAAIPAFIGALIGANLILSLPEHVLQGVVAVVLVGALSMILLGRKTTPESAEDGESELPRASVAGLGSVGLLGVYGGFFGGGVGLVLVPLLHHSFRLDYISANGVKSGLAAVMNTTAFTIFLWNGLIHWQEGLCLLFGMLIGANLGVESAVVRGEKWIRGAMILATTVAVALLLARF